MDRAEFTKKVLDQILFVVSSTQSYTEKTMAARKGRVDSASFQKWLIEERDKALSEPDFNHFDAVMKKWMGEPDAAALHLADTINFHFDGAVDWAEIWKQAKWILAGIPDKAVDLEQSIRQPFLIYRNVLKAETAAKVFSEQLEGAAQKPKNEPKPERVLPKLEDAYQGNIIDLWNDLSPMPKPLVSVSGQFIWEGENVSVLMALAQALVTANRIKPEYKQRAVYSMLCSHFGEIEPKRPRIRSETGSGYTNVYSDSLADFNDVFR